MDSMGQIATRRARSLQGVKVENGWFEDRKKMKERLTLEVPSVLRVHYAPVVGSAWKQSIYAGATVSTSVQRLKNQPLTSAGFRLART
jgi:hypothetical protein